MDNFIKKFLISFLAIILLAGVVVGLYFAIKGVSELPKNPGESEGEQSAITFVLDE